MKILLILLLLSTNAFAALTVGNVPKVKTGGSAPSMQDSNISEASGNVGIGTTTPLSILHAFKGVSDFRLSEGAASVTPSMAVINKSASGKAAALVAGTSGSSFNFDSAGYFVIQSDSKTNFTGNNLGGGATHFTVLPTGNIGIGTLLPMAKLVLADAGTIPTIFSSNSLVVSDSSGASDSGIISLISGASGASTVNFGDTADENAGFIQYRHNADAMDFGANTGTAMSISSTQNVGIGTTLPITKLTLASTGGATIGIVRTDSTTANGALRFYGSDMAQDAGIVYNNDVGGALTFVTNGNTRMALDSNGNLGIGSTTPSKTLDVNGAIRSSSTGVSFFGGNVGLGTTNPTAQLVVGSNGHILSQGSSSPTLSSCGTSPSVTTGSTDSVGEITVGTGTITSCTVTFVTAWDRTPHCFVQGNTTSNKTYALTNSTTTFVITSGSAFDSEVLDYLCIGN